MDSVFCFDNSVFFFLNTNLPSCQLFAVMFLVSFKLSFQFFITLLRFETLDAVRVFAGKDYKQPVIPPECKKLLKRHSEKSRHYRVVPLN